MQRYHTVPGSGDGIGAEVASHNVGEPIMRKDSTNGTWVLYDEALSAVRKATKEAEESQYGELNDQLKAEFQRGHQAAFDSQLALAMRQAADKALAVISPADDADQKAIYRKLLNELYHDRARLERVVKDAVTLIAELNGLTLSGVGGRELAGKLQQFITDHA